MNGRSISNVGVEWLLHAAAEVSTNSLVVGFLKRFLEQSSEQKSCSGKGFSMMRERWDWAARALLLAIIFLVWAIWVLFKSGLAGAFS